MSFLIIPVERLPKEYFQQYVDRLSNSAPSLTGPEFIYFTAGTVLGMSGWGLTGIKAYTGVSAGRYMKYCTRRYTQEALLHSGVGVVALVVLAWRGYIEILWSNIKRDMQKTLDTDGDGRFDMRDVQIIARKSAKLVKKGLSFFIGVGVGFYWG